MGPNPPPQTPLRTIGDEYIQPRHAVWPADKEKILLGPFDYLYGHPGKDIRSQLIASFNEWLRVPEEKLAVITKVVGMLHTASLLYVPCPLFIHLGLHTLADIQVGLTMLKTRRYCAAESLLPIVSSAYLRS
jgi:hypothetical protein